RGRRRGRCGGQGEGRAGDERQSDGDDQAATTGHVTPPCLGVAGEATAQGHTDVRMSTYHLDLYVGNPSPAQVSGTIETWPRIGPIAAGSSSPAPATRAFAM